MRPSRIRHSAFTLVEVLIATVLTLILMAATVTLFGSLTQDIGGSRGLIETTDRLRGAHDRLLRDLRWRTAPTLPPLDPASGLGYFKIKEGIVGPLSAYFNIGNPINGRAVYDLDGILTADSTYADSDDILMFTARSSEEPFIGRWNSTTTTQSQVAEIAWFVRGTTLYRRVLLVLPGQILPNEPRAFYGSYDVSVHQVAGDIVPGATTNTTPQLALNTLGDLTRPEYRYAHAPLNRNLALNGFPHEINIWTQLGLPTLRECSYVGGGLAQDWPYPKVRNGLPGAIPVTGMPMTQQGNFDFWTNPHPWPQVDRATGTLLNYGGNRIGEDIILTNVIGFDVKVWDPGAPVVRNAAGIILSPGDPGYDPRQTVMTHVSYGAYVDLGWWDVPPKLPAVRYTAAGTIGVSPIANAPAPWFNTVGNYMALRYNQAALHRVYDTWTTHYESDGVNQDGDYIDANGNNMFDPGEIPIIDEASDGFDNNGAGGVDDASEWEAPPPYPFPLRGVRIKIRVFEPDSRQVREVTIVQDFLPE